MNVLQKKSCITVKGYTIHSPALLSLYYRNPDHMVVVKTVSFILGIIAVFCSCRKQSPEIVFTNIPDPNLFMLE